MAIFDFTLLPPWYPGGLPCFSKKSLISRKSLCYLPGSLISRWFPFSYLIWDLVFREFPFSYIVCDLMSRWFHLQNLVGSFIPSGSHVCISNSLLYRDNQVVSLAYLSGLLISNGFPCYYLRLYRGISLLYLAVSSLNLFGYLLFPCVSLYKESCWGAFHR